MFKFGIWKMPVFLTGISLLTINSRTYKMKPAIYLTLIAAILLTSCSGTRKQLRNQPIFKSTSSVIAPEKKDDMATVPIKEVEEKVVSVTGSEQSYHRYYVIIGSFRYIENAKKHQRIVLEDGFSSELLRNESGLFRVSVLSTDNIAAARDDIRRIRSFFPKYNDTWLLIQKD